MIKFTEAFADFQYVGHRLLSFEYSYPKTKDTDHQYDYLIDFNTVHYEDGEDRHFGVIRLAIKVNEMVEDDEISTTVNMEIEGAFVGNPHLLTEEQFRNMLEINGVATLSHIARTQIMNVTSMSGANERIVLPMINILEVKEMKDKDTSS